VHIRESISLISS